MSNTLKVCATEEYVQNYVTQVNSNFIQDENYVQELLGKE